jgi:hypothetical protein
LSEEERSSFGAHLEDAMVMDRRPEGWVVFYSERGGEYSLTVHSDEASACADMLSRLGSAAHVFFDLIAGPAPAAEADAAFDEWLKQRGITRGDLPVTDWKFDDVPSVPGPYWRRYFVRIAQSGGYTQRPDLPRTGRRPCFRRHRVPRARLRPEGGVMKRKEEENQGVDGEDGARGEPRSARLLDPAPCEQLHAP